MPITKLADLADPELNPCLVIKVGSSLLVDDEGVRTVWLNSLVGEISEARRRGQNVIVVSSGAVALGARKLGFDKGGRGSLADAQASAAVGQITLSGMWAQLLENHGLTAAQMLVTLMDLEDRRRYLNVTATIERLLDAGVVPVINENDSITTQELKFGDNDRLAARVAQASGASSVILLSDIDGLYDRHPREPGATRLEVVKGITPEIKAMASTESNSGMGSGGMVSKLQAVEIAAIAGACVAIGNGFCERPVERMMGTGAGAGEGIGTLFLPRRRRGASKPGARKVWLGGRLRTKGKIIVDDGAMKALVHEGASLLAKGVIDVDGRFRRGDPVSIVSAQGTVIANGLAEYDAKEIHAIRRLHSNQQQAVLGYSPRSSVVHRDLMSIKYVPPVA
ncbi:glutamate 5-kinase [Novosphingobium sp. 1949]|uniref:Glutamate 5-kinase n=1 Tax=Novosphingobium organovorum TaxID=2930092 RepID=A0ABT0BI76_9SPHN|nr:glutamate 5-kinase [Novosphingobium organovorum]MCJ2184761.1 glutamate 5-kinase [Novosphingobium organovorum]